MSLLLLLLLLLLDRIGRIRRFRNQSIRPPKKLLERIE